MHARVEQTFGHPIVVRETKVSTQIETFENRPTNWTSSLTYQSRVTATPTAADLRELAVNAQALNRSLGLTGMLLYDKGRFFQTLEGPPDGLQAVWSSIQRDPRHSEIKVLSEHIIPARLFGAWDLLSYHGDIESYPIVHQAKAGHELTTRVPRLIDLVLNGDDLGINAMIAALAE